MIILPNFQGSTYTTSHSTGTLLPAQGSLVARFSSDSLDLANGADVTHWIDLVNLIDAGEVGGIPPTFTKNRINGYPSVTFNGSSSLGILQPGALKTAIDSQDCTIFVVFRSLDNSTGSLLSAYVGGTGFDLYAHGQDVGLNTDINVPFPAQSGFSTTGVASFKTTPNYSSSNELKTFYVNGCAVTNAASAMPSTSDHIISIGSSVKAEIFEILVWNRSLMPHQMMQLQMWACEKYAQPLPWDGLNDFNMFFGDGLMNGVGGSDVTKQPAWIAAQTLGLSLGQWSCIGIDGISLDHMNTLATSWTDPIPSLIKKTQNVISFEWYNQRDTSTTKGEAFLAARRRVVNQRTIWGTSTSASAIDPNANRATFNAAWDALWDVNPTFTDSYMPLHLDDHIGVNGSYALYSIGGDGNHLTDATYPYLAAKFVQGIADLNAAHLAYFLSMNLGDLRNTYILGL